MRAFKLLAIFLILHTVTWWLSENLLFQSLLKVCRMFSSVSQSAWVAIAKYHRPGGFNNIHLFLIVLKVGKTTLRVSEIDFLLRILLVCRLLLAVPFGGGGRESGPLVSFYNSTNPPWRLHPRDLTQPSLPRNSSVPNAITFGVSVLTHECCGGINIQSKAIPFIRSSVCMVF